MTKFFEDDLAATSLLLQIIMENPTIRATKSIRQKNITDSGKYGEKLPKSYVIFITETDVFARKRPLYHVERTIIENSIPFNDGSHIIYVNGENRDDTAVGQLMHDFSCSNPDDMKYKVLAEYLDLPLEKIKELAAQLQSQSWQGITIGISNFYTEKTVAHFVRDFKITLDTGRRYANWQENLLCASCRKMIVALYILCYNQKQSQAPFATG